MPIPKTPKALTTPEIDLLFFQYTYNSNENTTFNTRNNVPVDSTSNNFDAKILTSNLSSKNFSR